MRADNNSDFYLTIVKNYLNQLLAVKQLKRPKFNEICKQIHNCKNEYEKVIENHAGLCSLFLKMLDLKTIDVATPTLECIQKLIVYNYLPKLMESVENVDFLENLIVKIRNVYKCHIFNESFELCVIVTLGSISNQTKHLPPDLIIIIVIILIECDFSKSADNRAASFASLNTIVINLFQKLESATARRKEIVTNSTTSSVTTGISGKYSNGPDNKCETQSVHLGNSIHSDQASTTSKAVVIDEDSEKKIENKEFLNNLKSDGYEGVSQTRNPIVTVDIERDGTSQISEYKGLVHQLLENYDLQHETKDLINAFVLYETLCRLSLNSNDDPKGETESVKKSPSKNNQVTQLTLELIYTVLQHANSEFRTNDCFIEVTRKYLFAAITLPNITADHRRFKSCFNIFLILLEKFRTRLKFHFQVCFDEILFKVIESKTLHYEQLMFIFKELRNICSSEKFINVIFVNYDCDRVSHNIFERLINTFCSIAKDPTRVLNIQAHLTLPYITAISTNIQLMCLSCLNEILGLIKNRAEELKFNRATAETREKESNENITEIPAVKRESILALKERKVQMEEGIQLFNIKPLQGIENLIKNKFIEDSPESIASFLFVEDRLNPTKIGQILGNHRENWIAVMHRYVELFDFTNMELLAALRLFLGGFRIVGEGQIVDRIIEKFASHYCECNQQSSIFEHADEVYFLAFSILMLTTNLNNAKVKLKISPQQYVDMNRGAKLAENLTEDYLLEIYQSITKQQITLRNNTHNCTQIIDYATADINNIMNMAMKSHRIVYSDSFVEEIETSDATFLMFDTIWKHLLVCFGWVFKESDNLDIIYLCLNGIRSCVRISCLYSVNLARDTFITSLLPFTLLSKSTLHFSDIYPKNLAAIRTILLIAKEDGNFLSNSWTDILSCISNLQVVQNFKNDSKTLTVSFNSDVNRISTQPYSVRVPTMKSHSLNIFREISSQQLIVSVDQIFTNSITFDADSIIQFVSCLCHITEEELFHSTHPQVFFLQRILEVAYYNLERTRLVWNNIWSILGPFLIKVSDMDDENISILCIDSIRQISCKFLEKPEFSNFHFQSEFFKPFEHIMIHSKFVNVKELGIRCVLQLIQSHSANIKSGWKTVFNILAHACLEPTKNLEEVAFDTLYTIVDSHFVSVVQWFDTALMCIRSFCAKASVESLKIRAVRLLSVCFFKFKKDEVLHAVVFDDIRKKTMSFEQARWEHGYKKVLVCLVSIIQDTNTYVRAEALLLQFSLIKDNLGLLEIPLWVELFNVLFGSFTILERADSEINRQQKFSWLTETCTCTIMGILDLFVTNFTTFPASLVQEVFKHYQTCVSSKYEILATTTMFSFRRLLTKLHPKFTEEMWSFALDFVESTFKITSTDYFFDKVRRNSTPFISHNLKTDSTYEQYKSENLTNPLADYSSYDNELLSTLAPLIVAEKEKSINIVLHQVFIAIAHAKLDNDLLDTLNILLNYTLCQNEPHHHILSIPQTLRLISLSTGHKNLIRSFNTNIPLVVETAQEIETLSESLKNTWNSHIFPNLAVSEVTISYLILKLVSIYIDQCAYSQEVCLDIFNTHMCDIIYRFGSLSSSCTDATRCQYLIKFALDLINDCPFEFYVACMKWLLKPVCSLINVSLNQSNTELLMKVISRLQDMMTNS